MAKGIWGNRFVTYDTLIKIFGPKSHSILEDKILKHYQVFGGACALMEANFSKDKNNSSLYYCRNGSAESKAPPYANDLVRRNALILSACNNLVHNADSFDYLMEKTIIFPNTIDRAQKILQEFYPQLGTNKELVYEALKTSNKQIRFPFLTRFLPLKIFNDYELLREFTYYFCISEKWQKF